MRGTRRRGHSLRPLQRRLGASVGGSGGVGLRACAPRFARAQLTAGSPTHAVPPCQWPCRAAPRRSTAAAGPQRGGLTQLVHVRWLLEQPANLQLLLLNARGVLLADAPVQLRAPTHPPPCPFPSAWTLRRAVAANALGSGDAERKAPVPTSYPYGPSEVRVPSGECGCGGGGGGPRTHMRAWYRAWRRWAASGVCSPARTFPLHPSLLAPWGACGCVAVRSSAHEAPWW